jgi:hypothetical protein
VAFCGIKDVVVYVLRFVIRDMMSDILERVPSFVTVVLKVQHKIVESRVNVKYLCPLKAPHLKMDSLHPQLNLKNALRRKECKLRIAKNVLSSGAEL